MAWPKGKPRGPRVAKVADPIRESPRSASGRLQVTGHNGEVLTRKRPSNTDQFGIPPEIIPQGWEYQWNVTHVLGQEQVANRLAMQENGWRPVPTGRHKGMFMPNGTADNAPIIRDGLILEERPIQLGQEARAEEKMKAHKQMMDQQEQLRLSAKLPSGYSDDPKYRGVGASTNQSVGPAADIPRPRLSIDPDGA